MRKGHRHHPTRGLTGQKQSGSVNHKPGQAESISNSNQRGLAKAQGGDAYASGAMEVYVVKSNKSDISGSINDGLKKSEESEYSGNVILMTETSVGSGAIEGTDKLSNCIVLGKLRQRGQRLRADWREKVVKPRIK